MTLRKLRAEGMRWWGQIGANSHFYYKSYPCSAVYARRILADLGERLLPRRHGEPEAAEEDELEEVLPQIPELPAPDFPTDWNLHGAVMPDNLTPNENMQGWRPSTQLSQIQQNFQAEAGIGEDHFPLDIPDWTLNKRLMVAVSIELV